MNYRALCFVDMPFGKKPDLKSGVVVDFDQIYNEAIRPAIEECGLEALRGNEERTGGIIDRILDGPMFARLLLAEFVVIDLTLANANVFYELGIRHTARPFTTVPIFANVSPVPFDVALIRPVDYDLENGKLTQRSAQQLKTGLQKRLLASIRGVATNDSPLFQLIPEFPGLDLPERVVQAFQDRIRRAEEVREIFSLVRSHPTLAAKREALLKIQHDLGDLRIVQRWVLIELMFSFRDAEGFDEIVALYNLFPKYLQDYVLAKQQYALALYKLGDSEKALAILDELLKKRGTDRETLGITGRIHKDVYKEAAQAKKITATAALDDAISSYTKCFESDPRDYYPGVNAITLLIQRGDQEALKEAERLLPLVRFGASRGGGASSGDYSDLATVLELACIGGDWLIADQVLPQLLAATVSFKTATTLYNLKLLKRARERLGQAVPQLDGILMELSTRTSELRSDEQTKPR